MTIDAMDVLYTEEIDCFALVTSDSDFTPLVLKLLFKGKTVIDFAESTEGAVTSQPPHSGRMAA